MKNRLAQQYNPKVELLPYRKDVIDYIREQKKDGTTVHLISASPQAWVSKVANHLGIFEQAVGSTKVNLKGIKKYDYIANVLGIKKFIYVGDSKSDIPIWQNCGQAVTVNLSPILVNSLKPQVTIEKAIEDKGPVLNPIIKQLRLHQWSKNALLFLPMLAAHKMSAENIVNGLIAFLSFGMAASAVYVFNDLIDIDSDRNHHSKKHRPLAAGTLRIMDAMLLFFGLVTASLTIGSLVGVNFILVVFAYWFLNFIYTFYFKKEIVLDIILLSSMYTVRIFLGASAANVPVSHWLLSFTTLFFFSLACVKRHTELARSANKPTIDGRGYRGVDQPVVQTLGIGCALLSIVVLLLYAMSPETKTLYQNSDRLWLLTPLLLYWLGRLWLLVGRDQVHDDPVVFAIKDKTSWIVLVILLMVMMVAR